VTRRELLDAEFLSRRWASLRELAMADVTSPIQIKEMRRAFYAGAQAVFSGVKRVGEPDISEAEGVDFFERVDVELQAFLKAIEDGRA